MQKVFHEVRELSFCQSQFQQRAGNVDTIGQLTHQFPVQFLICHPPVLRHSFRRYRIRFFCLSKNFVRIFFGNVSHAIPSMISLRGYRSVPLLAVSSHGSYRFSLYDLFILPYFFTFRNGNGFFIWRKNDITSLAIFLRRSGQNTIVQFKPVNIILTKTEKGYESTEKNFFRMGYLDFRQCVWYNLRENNQI